MWCCELRPPHLLNLATLPCEGQDTKNVILQQEIMKGNCMICIVALSMWTRIIMCLKFPYLGYIHTAVHVWKKPFLTCENASCKLGLPLTSDIIDTAIDQWRDRLRSCVRAGGGHFEHMLWHECSFTWFIRTLYETGNIIWCMKWLFCS